MCSVEVGTSAIDGVLKSTADIIAQGKEALLTPSNFDDSDASDRHMYSDRSGSDSIRYSRVDAQLNVIRSDVRAYCEDPVYVEDCKNWKLGFVVGDKKGEIEKLVGDNGALKEIYTKVIPSEVDDATFWFRYFYKVYKLKQQEEMRAKLVKRSLSVDDEELLSWDVDEEDDDDKEEQQQQEIQEADQLRSNTTSKIQDLNDVREKETSDDGIKAQGANIVDEDEDKDKGIASNVISDDRNNVKEHEPGLSGKG